MIVHGRLWPLLNNTLPRVLSLFSFWAALLLQVALILAPRLLIQVIQSSNLGFKAGVKEAKLARVALCTCLLTFPPL